MTLCQKKLQCHYNPLQGTYKQYPIEFFCRQTLQIPKCKQVAGGWVCVHQCAARPNIGCNGHFDFSQGSRECTIVILACSSIFLDFARDHMYILSFWAFICNLYLLQLIGRKIQTSKRVDSVYSFGACASHLSANNWNHNHIVFQSHLNSASQLLLSIMEHINGAIPLVTMDQVYYFRFNFWMKRNLF